MTNVIIIEDEAPARRKLLSFIKTLGEEIVVLAEFETIADAMSYFAQPNEVNLIISDISLRDGNAFTLFEELRNLPPIIFTTAYDEYLMNAFETNGIAYLLKPYNIDQFKKAWQKFRLLQNRLTDQNAIIEKINTLITTSGGPMFKKRFAFQSGKGTFFLETIHIAFFASEDGIVFAVDASGKRHMLSVATLKGIVGQVAPAEFFQINRSELVNINFIERLERYGKNSISIKLKGIAKTLVTSQIKTAAFRDWVER